MPKNKKIKVAVLSGGPSSEHKISIKTGKMIAKTLDRNKYDTQEIVVDKSGKWPVSVEKLSADVVFIAMHGEYGEDGTVQKILENAGLPYTGSGVLASKLGMDKPAQLEIFRQNGLLVPEFKIINKTKSILSKWASLSGFSHPPSSSPRTVPEALVRGVLYPLVIKPANRGSSVGITIVKKSKDLPKALKEAFKYSDTAMVQQYIKGREVACCVIDDGKSNAIALPPTEIIPVKAEFFDYKAKYVPGASKEVTPPDLPSETIEAIRKTALKAHKLIGCSGMSRTDMILKTSNLEPRTSNIYALEINTIPGMTETSLLPQAARAAGISFPELLDGIIAAALVPLFCLQETLL